VAGRADQLGAARRGASRGKVIAPSLSTFAAMARATGPRTVTTPLVVTPQISRLGAPAVLVGASLGGHAALMAASGRPDLVRALVLADVTPWVDEDYADGIRAAMRLAARGFDTVEEAAAMVDRLRGTAPRSQREGLLPFLKQCEDGRLYWRWDPRFLEDRFVRHGGEGGMFAEAARRLKVPTLLMRAEFSTIVEPTHVARFKKDVPSLVCVEVEGVGHMVTGDANDAYAPVLIKFVRALES
jgi:pimeloyl-ACP methyl ester carboxylesterase